jgi:GNAT superfamily N-acetyltransferase
MTVVAIRGPALGAERDRVLTFLRSEGYATPIQESDQMFAAWVDDEVAGAVRLAIEEGTLVLRGMRVRSDLQRRGIGRQLLRRLDAEIGTRRCYCIPYAWLTGFYGTIGFTTMAPADAPVFLADRLVTYRQRGIDALVMMRPGDA